VGVELPEVSVVLWRERDLLGAVVSELEQEADGVDLDNEVPAPVADVLADLEDVQRQRRLVVDRAGLALGLPSGCTLADLASAAPEPWDDLLRRHIAALLAAANDVAVAAGQPPVGGPPPT
jgi:hypothetical protein